MRDRTAAPSRYLAEWYTPHLDVRAIADIAECVSRTLATMPRSETPPKLLYAIEIPDDGYAFGVFAADSAALVALVCERAGLPADRVSAAAEADLKRS